MEKKAEEFFTKVPNHSNKKCETLFPLLIDFDLKHCIKTETFKNSTSGRSSRKSSCRLHLLTFNNRMAYQPKIFDRNHRVEQLDESQSKDFGYFEDSTHIADTLIFGEGYTVANYMHPQSKIL